MASLQRIEYERGRYACKNYFMRILHTSMAEKTRYPPRHLLVGIGRQTRTRPGPGVVDDAYITEEGIRHRRTLRVR
jgi:hypothetical protein